MKRIFILTSIIFILTLHSLHGQKAWTLKECIKYACENNLQIRRQVLSSDILKNNFKQTKYNLLPTLNANGYMKWNYGKSVDNLNNQLVSENKTDMYSVESNLNLFNGMQNLNNYYAQKYQYFGSMEDNQKLINDITLQIALAYLQILFNKEMFDISSNQVEVTIMQVERTRSLVEVGKYAKGELYTIDAVLANEKLNCTNANNNLKLSYLDLIQLLDIDSINGFEVIAPEEIEVNIDTSLLDVDALFNKSLENLPQIKAALYRLKSSEKYLAYEQGKRSPSLTLNGRYSTGYSNITEDYEYLDQLDDNINKSLTLNLGIPIFNNKIVQTSISNAKITLLDTKYQLEIQKQILFKDIQQAHINAIAARERFISSLEAVKANQEAFRYIQQKFDVGILNSVEYNLSKTDLFKANSNLIQSKYDYIFKLKILDFYAGNPIEL